MKRLISWNVNGIRAAEGKGLYDWMQKEGADIIALQETKAQPQQLAEHFHNQPGYEVHFASAEKKGYSGVAVYTRETPLSVRTLGVEEFDNEGRTLILEYPEFTLLNCYFPNSQEAGKRLDYKLAFCDAILEEQNRILESGKNVVLCGDYNIAHKPIDLANPKRNEKNPGYLPEEREWMDKYIEAGYVDTFRMFNTDPDQYSWWSYRFQARAKNIGWRIDYFTVNEAFKEKVSSAGIRQEVMGSDHCPVEIELEV